MLRGQKGECVTEVNHELWMKSVIGKELNEAEARELYMSSRRESYKKDDALFSEGDHAVALFLIVSGDVHIEKRGPTGNIATIAKLNAGSIVGEMSLLTHETRSAAARVASDECTTLRIQWSDFQQMLNNDSASAYKLIYALASLLAGRLKRINLKVAELQSTTAQGEGEKLEEFAKFKSKLMRDWSF